MNISPPTILRGPSQPDLLRPETLADILEATAAQKPGHPALRFGDICLSYAGLDLRADLAAHHLIGQGVKPGDIVGLWLPRGIDLLVMQAGITKAGAAWLPFDADTPVERIAVCLSDAQARGLVTAPEYVPMLDTLKEPFWTSEDLSQSVDGVLMRRNGLLPEHPAYVIYTSGSTGKPKGIVIGQGSICHFLRSENAMLGVTGDDLVYQGFSVAFDMSFEEVWISYLVGASLWIAPREIVADPDALPRALSEQGVTVLHAVPTLLALFAEDVPTLRLINLGGEMCPESLVDRWDKPGRQMFNTYGPTEATVSASLARLHRGETVTIGVPLPNYGLLVVDEAQKVVSQGDIGELCIIGPGVAQGYLGRPDLTAEKFLPNPYAVNEDEARLYRTGDLARIDESGNVQCLGRADDQVKIRGFRVELGEIETVLCQQPGVGTVAVLLRQDNEIDQLVAYVVVEAGVSLTIPTLREGLSEQLPPYMVPARYEFLDRLPRLTSGKIDRKALRAMPLTLLAHNDESDIPQDDAERVLFAALNTLFPSQPLRRTSDFFTDLGGHSLLAARLVSALRADTRFGHITVRMVYQERCLGAIAEALRRAEQPKTIHRKYVPPATNTTWRRLRCGLAQLAILPFLICFGITSWLAPFFTYHTLSDDKGGTIGRAIAVSLVVFLLSLLLNLLLAILAKRIVLGRLQPGRYPLWGITYFRWWLTDRLTDLAPDYLLHGSSLYVLYLRALGMKIGRDVMIGSVSMRVPHLISIGDGASIGSAVNLENAYVERGELVIGCIDIAREAYVGSYAAIEGNTVMGEYARLNGLSSLQEGQRIPRHGIWDGAPSRQVGEVDLSSRPERPTVGTVHRWVELVFFAVGAAGIAVLFFMPLFPVFIFVDWIDNIWMTPSLAEDGHILVAIQYGILALPAAAAMVLLTALLSAIIRWCALPRLKPGRWPVHSDMYYRKWLTNQIQESSLHTLHGIYATVYAPWWYRLLGAKIGKGAEISTAMGVVPDMLTLGDDSFIADAVMLGDEEIDGGWMTLRHTTVGHRSFVGNGAYVPDGTKLPPEVLIGVQSKPPSNEQMTPGDTWMGSPPLKLPARESLGGFPDSLTFRPSPLRRLARASVEAARIVLPLAIAIGVGYLIVFDTIPYADNGDWLAVVLFLARAGILYGIGSYLFIVALKWLLIGRYRPHMAPMWTPFVWLSEAVTNLYEAIAVPGLLSQLRGTPMLPWLLRPFGVKIGRGVYLDTTDITEYDCASIGDYSELNAWTGPQTHLFEDRIMKIGIVHIGRGVTIRTRSTILYDAEVGDGARLGTLTLVMKGEQIQSHSDWSGSPASPWRVLENRPIMEEPILVLEGGQA